MGGEESFHANLNGEDTPLVSAIFINNYNIQGVQKLPVKLDMFWVGWLYQYYTPSKPNANNSLCFVWGIKVFPHFLKGVRGYNSIDINSNKIYDLGA